MALKLTSGGKMNMRNITLADRVGAFVSYDAVAELITGTDPVAVAVQDANFLRYTNGTSYLKGSVSTANMPAVELTNLNPEVATVSYDYSVDRLRSGICRLILKSNGLALPLELDLRTTGGTTTDIYDSPVADSLSGVINSQFATRITAGMSINLNGRLYSEKTHATSVYKRQPNVWCNDIVDQLFCISPYNDYSNPNKPQETNPNNRAGTLITPQHVLVAAHYPLFVGNTLRFVKGNRLKEDGTEYPNNFVYERTITGAVTDASYSPIYPDLRVCTLNAPLTQDIIPAQVMPANWLDYMPQIAHNKTDTLLLDAEEKALVWAISGGRSQESMRKYFYFVDSLANERKVFNEQPISGDSGNPVFLIVDGKLVLLTVLTAGQLTNAIKASGTSTSGHIAMLNALIAAADAEAGISTGYTVTPADFTSYPYYGTGTTSANTLTFAGETLTFAGTPLTYN